MGIKYSVNMNVNSARQDLLAICCTLFIAITTSCGSQNQSKKVNQIVYSNISHSIESKIDTPLLKFTSGIRTILEDNNGHIWFGSNQEGVALFDGKNLTYFDTSSGLSDLQIRSIFEDGKGTIWFEGATGLSSYDGKKITARKSRDYNSKDKWPTDIDILWFKGDESNGYNNAEKSPGVYAYDGKEISYYTFPIVPMIGEDFYYSVTTSFVKDRSDRVWFGTYGAVIGYDGSDFTIIDNNYLGLNKITGLLHIRSIMVDSKGNLWIGNNGIGVFKYDGTKTVHVTEQTNLKVEGNPRNSLKRVFAIGEDALGNIWFGTAESGVWRYDGNYVKNFTKEDGLESDHIWKIYQSKQGELWFAGANPSGVYRFDGESFERKF